jgi:hypothetical protein
MRLVHPVRDVGLTEGLAYIRAAREEREWDVGGCLVGWKMSRIAWVRILDGAELYGVGGVSRRRGG